MSAHAVVHAQPSLAHNWVNFWAHCAEPNPPGLELLDVEDSPESYCLALNRIEGIPGPPRKRDHTYKYSARLSLFHKPSSTFFGETWRSQPVPASRAHKDKSVTVSFDKDPDVVLFCSRINSSDCVAVLELVMVDTDDDTGTRAESAVGWAIINIFKTRDYLPTLGSSKRGGGGGRRKASRHRDDDDDDEYDDYSDDDNDRGRSGGGGGGNLDVDVMYYGSPRALCVVAEADYSTKLRTSEARIYSSLSRFDQLSKISHLFLENQFIGLHSLVPGMEPRKVPGATQRQPCIGGEDRKGRGSGGDTFVPRFSLSPVCGLQLNEFEVCLPAEWDRRVLQQVRVISLCRVIASLLVGCRIPTNSLSPSVACVGRSRVYLQSSCPGLRLLD